MRRIAAQVSQSRVRQRSESPQPSRSQRRRTEPAEHSSRSRSPAAVRGRGCNAAGCGQPPAPTPPSPGHESHGLTVNTFSVTSGILGQNCPSAWLEAHRRWARCCSSPWFAFSLELGSRRDPLHVQGVVKIRFPGDKRSVKQLSDHVKGFLHVIPGDNTRVLTKLCQSGPTDQYMLGYILKDQGQSHFEVRV